MKLASLQILRFVGSVQILKELFVLFACVARCVPRIFVCERVTKVRECAVQKVGFVIIERERCECEVDSVNNQFSISVISGR